MMRALVGWSDTVAQTREHIIIYLEIFSKDWYTFVSESQGDSVVGNIGRGQILSM